MKSVLLDSEFSDLGFERRSRDSEPCGSAGSSRHAPSTFGESGFYQPALIFCIQASQAIAIVPA